MTVLNAESDGMLNVLLVLVRAAVVLGPSPRADLLGYCSAGLQEQPQRLGRTLTRWTGLGLFRNDQDTFRLNDAFGLPTDPASVLLALPSTLRRIVFDPVNNDRFWQTEGCADLTRGLAWLLAQDIYEVDVSSTSSLQTLDAQQLVDADRRILQNDTRIDPLRILAHYMGFLWSADDSIIDPTAALRQDLPLIFGDNTELSAADLVQRAANVIPVLDGGTYRMKLEEALDTAHWQRPSHPRLLSTALSRALWRLEDMGLLVLQARADAGDNRVLQRSGRREWRGFTHVRLQGVAA
jgi:hypothetical protein